LLRRRGYGQSRHRPRLSSRPQVSPLVRPPPFSATGSPSRSSTTRKASGIILCCAARLEPLPWPFFTRPRTPPETARTRLLSNNLQTNGPPVGASVARKARGRATITCYLAHASNVSLQGVPIQVILVYGRGTHKRSMDSAIRRICLWLP